MFSRFANIFTNQSYLLFYYNFKNVASQIESDEEITDIIQEKPELVKTIEDEQAVKLIMDDLYYPILKVLRKGPKTVKEIEKEYNQIAKETKSDKTIYRYLKKLQETDLVKVAGQRVTSNKTATETLFIRTAYAFYLRNEYSEFWKTEEGNRLVSAIGTLLKPVINEISSSDKELTPNIDKLETFFYDLSESRLTALKKYLNDMDKEVLENISDLDWRKFTAFYDLGGIMIVLLQQPELLEDLKQCFD